MISSRFGSFCALFTSAFLIVLLCGIGAKTVLGATTVGESENAAKRALNAATVQAFDTAMTFVGQSFVENPAGGAQREVRYDINGPGDGVKSNVEYRIYSTPKDAESHSNPDLTQQKAEATANEMPHGSFKTYHSTLGGSALAQDVPGTFRCIAETGNASWSRCYYYPGSGSNIVVVGTTTASQANEAIMITAMGAQGLAEKK